MAHRDRSLGPQMARTRRQIAELTKRIMKRRDKNDPTHLPKIVEDEERALRALQRFYDGLERAAAKYEPRSAQTVVIDLNGISTDELKRQLAENKE